jgi:glycosyltransferase involved in cell wall biosynthesis
MSATSDISVIIPYYNREQYVDEAVQSVLRQTLKPLEIIIVNDCSRESSRRYLDRYADLCTILDLKVNVGLAGSRNAGIRAARGQFIALLDDDDIWLPEKLEKQRKYVEEHPGCSAVHSQVWAFFPDKQQQLWSSFNAGPMPLSDALLDERWVVPSTLMVRTNVIRALGGFDERFRECEDRDFMIRCAAAGYAIEGIAEPLTRLRRMSDDSLSERRWRMFLVHVRIVWIHRAHFYRAYGLRGPMNFLLRTLFIASCKTRFVDGPVRFLLRVVKVKWEVKSGYQDPVLAHMRPLQAQGPGVSLQT